MVLGDGTELDADLVIVGIGSHPAIEWLDGSGIEIDNGVVCDEVGRASAPHVWAIGDVASWRDTVGGQVRVEHWSNVADQARVLVPSLLGQDPPAAVSVPYFWSDQYDVKIQAWASPRPPTPCTSSRTTAASSWPTTSATVWSSVSSAADSRARS